MENNAEMFPIDKTPYDGLTEAFLKESGDYITKTKEHLRALFAAIETMVEEEGSLDLQALFSLADELFEELRDSLDAMLPNGVDEGVAIALSAHYTLVREALIRDRKKMEAEIVATRKHLDSYRSPVANKTVQKRAKGGRHG